MTGFGYSLFYSDLYGGPFDSTTVVPGPPTNALIPTDEILDLGVSVRADRFEFDLLNLQHEKVGTLDVSQTSAPTVTVDTTRQATRALTSLTLLRAADLAEIDPIRHRVQPSIVLQNGERFSLGIYMFGQQNTTPYSWGNTLTPELVDETFLLDRALETTATLPTGGSLIGLIADLLAPIYLPSGTIIEASDQASTSPLMYRVGSGRYSALAATAALLGCYPPFFDNQGVLRFKAAPAPADLSVDHTYALGSRIIDGTLTTSSTAYRAPNRYMVIGDDPTSPVRGIYDLPPAAPHSAAQTGYIVITQRNMQGLADQTVADLAAYVDALTDRTTYQTITFSSTADPRHDTYNTMSVLGIRYLETGWSLQCTPGGVMTHQGTVLWH
jgi:hypothetical protein